MGRYEKEMTQKEGFAKNGFPTPWRSIVLVAVLFLVGVIAFWGKGFASPGSLQSMVRRAASEGGILALGMTFVLLTGQIDLSGGAIVALSGVLGAVLQPEGGFIVLAAAICIGAICGFINGMLVTGLHIPSWLATLGSMYIFRNIAQLISRQRTISVTSLTWQRLGSMQFLGIHIAIWIFVVLTLLCMFIGAYTGFGRSLHACNRQPSGKETSPGRDRVIVSAFTCSGMLAGLAGVLLAGRLNTVSYTTGTGWEISALAMCVLGGVGFCGGKGSFLGVFFGALAVSLITTLCNFSGFLGVEWQMIILTVVVLCAAALDFGFPRKKHRE